MNINWLKGYLYFNRKERRSLVVLLVLLLLFAFFPHLFPYMLKPRIVPADPVFQQKLASFMDSAMRPHEHATVTITQKQAQLSSHTSVFNAAATLRPFPFDPNTVTADALLQMGLPPKLVATWMNYRHKGGRFSKAEDIQRIYGMQSDLYRQIKPYVHIQSTWALARQHQQPAAFPSSASSMPPKTAATINTIDINTADTTAWKALPGIGSRLAQRIVNFRDKLGGFVHIEQVGETYALPDSTFWQILPRLRLDATPIRKIDINHVTPSELSQHPYINFRLAKAIIAYREANGAFTNTDDLRKIALLSDSVFQKIRPYIDIR